jgi:hypothetical protein
MCKNAQIFQKCRSHVKILGAIVQNVVARATWRLGFVHPYECVRRSYFMYHLIHVSFRVASLLVKASRPTLVQCLRSFT